MFSCLALSYCWSCFHAYNIQTLKGSLAPLAHIVAFPIVTTKKVKKIFEKLKSADETNFHLMIKEHETVVD
jgi:hypothetical protein